MYERVYLRRVDAGTPNECWVVCAKGDPGALAFVQETDMEDAVSEARSDGYEDGCRDTEERME